MDKSIIKWKLHTVECFLKILQSTSYELGSPDVFYYHSIQQRDAHTEHSGLGVYQHCVVSIGYRLIVLKESPRNNKVRGTIISLVVVALFERMCF